MWTWQLKKAGPHQRPANFGVDMSAGEGIVSTLPIGQQRENAMRFTAIVVVFVLASAAHAQTGANTLTRNPQDLFGRGAPKQITFTPIDTSKALAPQPSISQAIRPPSSKANTPFNLSSVFPKISMPSWPPKTVQTSVLPQSQNIFQPTPPKGAVSLFGGANNRVN